MVRGVLGRVYITRWWDSWRRRSRRAILAIVLALLNFAVLLVVVRNTAALDLRVTRFAQRAEHPAVLGVLLAVSWLGWQPQQMLLVAGILGWLFLRRRYRLEGVFAALALAVGALNDLLKLVTLRPRPSAALADIVVHGHVRGTSFPSGHVMTYVLFYGFLAYLVYTHVRRPALRWALLAPLLALVALVGPSRVYLGHHWFTDALGSYLLGGALLAILVLAYRAVREARPAGAGALEEET